MNIARVRIPVLSDRDEAFLKRLVFFGGACTRWQAQQALKIKDKEHARLKLQKFVKIGLLVTQDLSGLVPSGPLVYIPSRTLAQNYGCDRREPKDAEHLVEKCYRFYISTLVHEPLNYLSNHKALPVSPDKLQSIQNAHRDEIYCAQSNTIYIDIQTTWPRSKTRNRILFWAMALPNSKIELCSTFARTCDLAKADLSESVQERVVRGTHYEPLSAAYAYSYRPNTEEQNEEIESS